MKSKKTITKFIGTLAIAVVSISSGFAQTNLGAACGCPTPATSRPQVLLSNLADASGNLTAKNTILDCSKLWIIDKKIYVPNGSVLTIEPGTLIEGLTRSTADSATALIVSRGGKIFAAGTPDCQIVFTVKNDPLDGSLSTCTATASKWGGISIAGQASNNLLLSNNGPFQPLVGDGKIAVANGLGTFEGFATSDFRNQFGVNLTTPQAGYNTAFDDNDNSGILRYVSIRFAGAILQVGGEINGLSLGSVGRGTTLDHIEIISGADDAIEWWGGTVNLKYASIMFGNDDGLDWDDGYSGKIQNVFLVKSSSNDTASAATKDADNGIEADNDDQQSGNGSGAAIGAATGYRSHPVVYNVTMIGNNKRQETSDNTGIAAIMAKELTEGEIYSSIFANFAIGVDLWQGNLSAPQGHPQEGVRVMTTSSTGQSVLDSYDNWRDNNGTPSLKIKCNTFVGIGTGTTGGPFHSASANGAPNLVLDVTRSTGTNSYYLNPSSHYPTVRDSVQFYATDQNTAVSSIPGFTYLWQLNCPNSVVTKYDATPNPLITNIGCVAPSDGFFSQQNYRGAFAPGVKSWLSDWSYAALLGTTAGLIPCPTDINGDGLTNTVDFLQLLSQFNLPCN